MWKCPKCAREFNKNNQGHFCAAVGTTVDSYIDQTEPEQRDILLKLRVIIKKAAPDATEKLSCHMPTYWQKENILQYAAHKNHLGFYPFEDAVNHFTQRIVEAGYTYNKGCIQIPWQLPIDANLITDIIKYRLEKISENV